MRPLSFCGPRVPFRQPASRPRGRFRHLPKGRVVVEGSVAGPASRDYVSAEWADLGRTRSLPPVLWLDGRDSTPPIDPEGHRTQRRTATDRRGSTASTVATCL